MKLDCQVGGERHYTFFHNLFFKKMSPNVMFKKKTMSKNCSLNLFYIGDKESFFEHYEVLILVGCEHKSIKFESLYDRFDCALTGNITS